LGQYSSYSGLVYPVKAVLAPGAYVSRFATMRAGQPNWSDAQFHAGDRCVTSPAVGSISYGQTPRQCLSTAPCLQKFTFLV